MNNITPKQRSKLRALAHHLKPLVLIGKSGISSGVIVSISQLLDSHELIKVKFLDNTYNRNEFLDIVKSNLSCSVVGEIGRTFILYKYQEDNKKRKIRL